jgi:hypothetical protein
MLAKILATENITIVHAGVRTATFDLKRRILTLPIWKDMSGDVYDLLLMHEVAHALFSSNIGPLLLPACEKIDPKFPKAAKRFINVVLDAKDERLIKATYPGGRGSFIRGYAELIERNFFGTKDQDINDFGIVDRLNMYFKTGNLDIEFSDKEMDFIREIEKVMTFEKVVNICERLYQYAKEERDRKKAEEEEDGEDESEEKNQDSTEQKKNKSSKSKEEDDEDDELIDPDDESGDESGDGEETDEDSGETEDETDEAGETTEAEETDEDATDDEDEKSSETDKTKTTEDNVDDSPIESVTDKTWEETQEDLCDPNARPILYLGIPIPKLNKIIVPYKTVHEEIRKFYTSGEIIKQHTIEFDRFKQENKPVVDWLIKEFELHKSADQYARTKTAKTGILNLNRLSQYKFSDDMMLKVSAITGGQNHALEIFIDWSGSMNSHVLGTIHQVINLATFARKEQIPFNAYTFGSLCVHSKQKDYSFSHANMDEFEHHPNDFAFFVGFKLRQILSNKMSASEFNEACVNLLMLASGATRGYSTNRFICNMPGLPKNDCMGGTPLNEAMTAASYIVDELRLKSNIQIVNVIFITDGEATTDGRYVRNEFGDCSTIDYGKEDVFLRDTNTHIDYPLGNDGIENTRQFINILRNRTKVNVIGFFISGDKEDKIDETISKYCHTRWLKTEEKEKLHKELIDNNFILVKDMGYSEFYLIPGGSKLRINLPRTQLNPMMSTHQMVTAMTQHGLEQRKQRVVLTRFIKLIS